MASFIQDLQLARRTAGSPISTMIGSAALLAGGLDSVPPEVLDLIRETLSSGEGGSWPLVLVGIYLFLKRDVRSGEK